ncbi:MAG: OB-fold nucleic acid binding domain-containing protein [Desulfomonilaceae bacterium]
MKSPAATDKYWVSYRFKVPDKTSDVTTVLREAASMSVFCRKHPLAVLRSELRQQRVVTARQLRNMPGGRRVRLSGLLIIVHTPPTKSGKRVMFLTLEDETGLWDAVAFSRVQKDFARVIYTSELLTVEGKLQRQGGYGVSISVIIEKVILPWSGLLSGILKKMQDSRG